MQFDMHYERDQSDTDVLWQVYNIRVRGFVSNSQQAFPGVGNFPESTAEVLNLGAPKIKTALETPRKPCLYSIDGQTIVSVGNAGDASAIDAHLGPWPQKATCIPVSSGLFMVECGFEARVIDCADACPPQSRDPVVSLRYTQSESFDETWHSKLITRGRVVVRSDMMITADNFRLRCTPTIAPDYVRTTANYVLSPSGTELDFEFVDEEKDFLPPALAIKADGRFVVNVTGGAKRMGMVDLTLQGTKESSRRDLMVKAISMGMAKLKNEGFADDSNPIVNGTFSEDLLVNKVTVQMQALLTTMPGAGGIASSSSSTIGGGALLGTILGFLKSGARGALRGGLWGAVLDVGITLGGKVIDLFKAGDPSAFAGDIAGAIANALNPDQRPAVMRTVGEMPGLSQGRLGLAPPIRKRIATFLAAAFRDPCACLASETDTTMTASGPSGSGPNSSPPGTDTTNPYAAPASITVGVISALPTGAPVIVDEAPYNHYEVIEQYSFSSGKVQMPGTGVGPNGNKSAFVAVSGGGMSLEVNWTASRSGVPPILPTFLPPNSNYVPLEGHILTNQIEPEADNICVKYTVSGKYKYGIADPSQVSLSHPIPPFLSDQVIASGERATQSMSDVILWNFRSSGSGNPFYRGGNPVDQPPDSTLATDLASGIIGGLSAALSSGSQPSGGLESGSQNSPFTEPPVNP